MIHSCLVCVWTISIDVKTCIQLTYAGGLRLLNRTQANEDACWEVCSYSGTPEWCTGHPISIFHWSGMGLSGLSREPLSRPIHVSWHPCCTVSTIWQLWFVCWLLLDNSFCDHNLDFVYWVWQCRIVRYLQRGSFQFTLFFSLLPGTIEVCFARQTHSTSQKKIRASLSVLLYERVYACMQAGWQGGR